MNRKLHDSLNSVCCEINSLLCRCDTILSICIRVAAQRAVAYILEENLNVLCLAYYSLEFIQLNWREEVASRLSLNDELNTDVTELRAEVIPSLTVTAFICWNVSINIKRISCYALVDERERIALICEITTLLISLLVVLESCVESCVGRNSVRSIEHHCVPARI